MINGSREKLRVAAVFEPGGRLRPVWFEWNRRRHMVRETTYVWKAMRGNAGLIHFAVSDEAGLYELVYNTSDQTWTLAGVEA